MHFRFLAGLCALVALLAFVTDLTPALSSDAPFRGTTVAEHWKSLIPASFEGAKRSVTASPVSFLWALAIEPVLNGTSFIVLSLFALLFGYIGRRRRRIKIFAN
jgi:hypothetical protein